ncbi:MAG TPA: hypothetical protein VFB34_09315 [Chloroflexota bacterium]|nr:hypothetical protein [Chloroflexota bacterium]
MPFRRRVAGFAAYRQGRGSGEAADMSEQERQQNRIALPQLTGGWRARVRYQAGRIEADLYTVNNPESRLAVRVQASVDRARAASGRRAGAFEWFSGSLEEEAYGHLETARETLVMLEDDDSVRAQMSSFASLAGASYGSPPSDPPTAGEIRANLDRSAMRRLLRDQDAAAAERRAAIRELRNRVLGITFLLTLGLLIATLVVSPVFLRVMGLGALAGLLTAVVPLSRAPGRHESDGLLGAVALLKIPAGGVTALLGVVLLRKGLGGLQPARDGIALFYAVLLGLLQQALTGHVDRQALYLTSDEASPAPATTHPPVPPTG